MEQVNFHVVSQGFCSCQQCQSNNVLIQESVQFIPAVYPTSNKSHKDTQFQRRVHNSLREFTEKYAVSKFDYQEELKEKVKKMRRHEPTTKGLRQTAAVVVYMSLRGQLRDSFKDFCKGNSLNLKVCNRKYKVYHKLFQVNDVVSQEVEGYEQSMGIKVQERIDGPKYSDIYEVLNESEYANEDIKFINNLQVEELNKPKETENYINHWFRAIDSIFDSVFKGFFYKTNKQIIISKLIEHLQKIDPIYLDSLNVYQKGPQIYYYVLFSILKYFKFKIYFHSFNETLKKQAGYSLSRKKTIEIKKSLAPHFKQLFYDQKQDSEKSDNFQEKKMVEIKNVKKEGFKANDDILIVESPLILQEELFSFDNCYYFPNQNDSFD